MEFHVECFSESENQSISPTCNSMDLMSSQKTVRNLAQKVRYVNMRLHASHGDWLGISSWHPEVLSSFNLTDNAHAHDTAILHVF